MDLEGYVKAINGHDWDGIVSFMTDDVSYEDVALGEKHKGKADVKDFWKRAATEFSSNFQMQVVRGFQTETDYAAEWVFKGKHDGSSPQLPATGKEFAVRGVSIGKLEHGQIKENTDVWNLAEFLQQVGMMPAPAGAAST